MKIKNQPVTRNSSGLKGETQMATVPPPNVRQKKRIVKLQPPGNASPFAPKRKKSHELTDADHSRDGFEVSGVDASQDFTGLSCADAHYDNLMQQTYENVLRAHGF